MFFFTGIPQDARSLGEINRPKLSTSLLEEQLTVAWSRKLGYYSSAGLLTSGGGISGTTYLPIGCS